MWSGMNMSLWKIFEQGWKINDIDVIKAYIQMKYIFMYSGIP